MNVLEIIEKVAKIPSFTGYEDRLHPFIFDFIRRNKIKCNTYRHFNNLIIEINGHFAAKYPTIAFTAHLDKINHFFEEQITELPFATEEEHVKGQMDDSVGVGICLYLLSQAKVFKLPHCLFLFSEMEEGTVIRAGQVPRGNQLLFPQIGAVRISHFLIKKNIIPSIIITIDTTPFFRGNAGIALYSKFWEISGNNPLPEVIQRTKKVEKVFKEIHPEIVLRNNINDYVRYGQTFTENKIPVVSIAVEPGIFPYHTIGEKVFISDIYKVLDILKQFISIYRRRRTLRGAFT